MLVAQEKRQNLESDNWVKVVLAFIWCARFDARKCFCIVWCGETNEYHFCMKMQVCSDVRQTCASFEILKEVLWSSIEIICMACFSDKMSMGKIW